MSSKLGKSNKSKSESVNTVSSTSTSELMPPPLPREPKKTRRFVAPSIPVVPNEPNVPSVPVVPSENVRKRKRTENNSIGLSNLEFIEWGKNQIVFLDEVWEKNKLEQRGTTSENTLALLVEAIDSIESNDSTEKIKEEKKQKKEWIRKNLQFMYKEKRKKIKEMQKLQRNEEIANTLSMGSNDELKETILRFLNKSHK